MPRDAAIASPVTNRHALGTDFEVGSPAQSRPDRMVILVTHDLANQFEALEIFLRPACLVDHAL